MTSLSSVTILSAFVVLALTSINLAPIATSAADTQNAPPPAVAGVTIAACPSQEALPSSTTYQFISHIASDSYISSCHVSNFPAGLKGTALDNEMNAISGCEDEITNCVVASALCEKDMSYGITFSIRCTDVKSIATYTSQADMEAANSDNTVTLNYDVNNPPAVIFVTKVTFRVKMDANSSFNCTCPQS